MTISSQSLPRLPIRMNQATVGAQEPGKLAPETVAVLPKMQTAPTELHAPAEVDASSELKATATPPTKLEDLRSARDAVRAAAANKAQEAAEAAQIAAVERVFRGIRSKLVGQAKAGDGVWCETLIPSGVSHAMILDACAKRFPGFEARVAWGVSDSGVTGWDRWMTRQNVLIISGPGEYPYDNEASRLGRSYKFYNEERVPTPTQVTAADGAIVSTQSASDDKISAIEGDHSPHVQSKRHLFLRALVEPRTWLSASVGALAGGLFCAFGLGGGVLSAIVGAATTGLIRASIGIARAKEATPLPFDSLVEQLDRVREKKVIDFVETLRSEMNIGAQSGESIAACVVLKNGALAKQLYDRCLDIFPDFEVRVFQKSEYYKRTHGVFDDRVTLTVSAPGENWSGVTQKAWEKVRGNTGRWVPTGDFSEEVASRMPCPELDAPQRVPEADLRCYVIRHVGDQRTGDERRCGQHREHFVDRIPKPGCSSSYQAIAS